MAANALERANPFRLLIPARDVLAGGDVCIRVPVRMAAYIQGMLAPLMDFDVWEGTPEQKVLAVRQIETFLAEMLINTCEPKTETVIIENETIVTIAGCDSECGECDMSCQGIPPGFIRWGDNGQLQTLFCGTWYDVGGEAGEVIPPVIDILEPPPDAVDSTACAIAAALADVVQDIIEEAFDEFVFTTNPLSFFTFFSKMQSAVPGVDLDWGELSNVWGYVAVMKTAGLDSKATDTLFSRYLKCYWASELSPTNDGITSEVYDALCVSAETPIRLAANQIGGFSLLTNSVVGMWLSAIKAIGPGDAKRITYYAQPTEAELCECPEVILVEPSAIFFNGGSAWAGGDPDSTIEISALEYGGRRVKIHQHGNDVTFPSITDFDALLSGAQSGDYITVRVYPALGSKVPGRDWYATETITPPQWFDVSVQGAAGAMTRFDYPDYVEWACLPGTPNAVRIEDARMYPPNAGPYDWYYYMEIVGVNGVPLTPIGP